MMTSRMGRADRVFNLLALILIVAILCRGGCVSEDDAQVSATRAGVQQVVITEDHHFMPGFWGCDFSDPAGFEFTGEWIDGQPTTGIICCGAIFKSCTLRF